MKDVQEFNIIVDSPQKTKQQALAIEVTVDGRRYYLDHEISNAPGEGMWRYYLISAMISSVIFYLIASYLNLDTIALTGELSLGSFIVVISFLVNLIVLPIYLVKLKTNNTENQLKYIYWRNFPTIIISYLIIQITMLLFIFWSVGQLFTGLTLDIPAATFQAFIVFLMVHYAGITFINGLSARKMIRFLMLFLMSGFLVAMVTNADSQWWHHHISFLGSYAAKYGWRFNLTLVLTSLLMVALTDYLFVMIKRYYPEHSGLRYLNVMLIVIAACIAGVGLFRSDAAGQIKYYHTYVIYLMMVVVAIIIIFARRLIPNVSKEFLKMSYGTGILLIVLTILYMFEYLHLIVYEVIGVPLALMWLMSLFDTLYSLTHAQVKYQINIIEK